MTGNKRKVGLIKNGLNDPGFACSRTMVGMGMDLVVVDLFERPDRLEALRSGGTNVLYIEPDGSSECLLGNYISRTFEEFGGLDVCMICDTKHLNVKPFLDLWYDPWQAAVNHTLNACFHILRWVSLDWIKMGAKGKFIFAGVSGQGYPHHEIMSHIIPMAAIRALVRCAAPTLTPHGITVNAILPDVDDADLTVSDTLDWPASGERLERLVQRGGVQPDGCLADLVSFLASESSDGLTGMTLSCKGTEPGIPA
jgi:NAD(P)-dependent dehydrogenase (short-subunit alcohol dehydrogenase family)